jgi:hypothetical protein
MKKLASLAAAGVLAFSSGAMKPNEAKADVAGAVLVGAVVGITAAALIAASSRHAYAGPVAYHSYAPAAPAFGVGIPPFFGIGFGPGYGWGYGPAYGPAYGYGYGYGHRGYRQRVIVRERAAPRRAAPRQAVVRDGAVQPRRASRGGRGARR